VTTLLDEGALTAARTWCADAPVEVHEQIGSTNDRVAELATTGAPEGTLVVARLQTAGRGRRGRSWASPEGGLYFSFLLRPTADSLRSGLPATLVAGLALCQALEGLTPPDAQPELKWPNDVLIRGKKVSGILGEMSQDAAGPALVLGLGVNTGAAELPIELDSIATQLPRVGARPAPAEVLRAFFASFGPLWTNLNAGQEGAREALLSAAAQRMPSLGHAVRLRLANEVVEGVFRGLGPSGGLVLEREGRTQTYLAGDVESARPQ
jgi:BirA family transcriptional regulator, biotin operon repressor / biotin---[acetyl-CoA-carboxylase] ligase